MRKKLAFTIFDSASQIYGPPILLLTRGEAIRVFSNEVNSGKKDYPLCQHPEDFIMYECGTWDDNLGRFEPHENNEIVARGKDLVVQVN